VTLNGKGLALPEWTGLFTIADTKYIRVSGLRVINSEEGRNPCRWFEAHRHREQPHLQYGRFGIAVWGSYDVVVDGNEVELACNDGEGECITVSTTDTFEVRFNHVHHGGPGPMGGRE